MNNATPRQIGIGYLYVVIAAILFAISGTAAKFLFNSGVTALQLIRMRTTPAFFGLLIWLCFRYPAGLKISPKDLPYFFMLGVFGIGCAQFFYLFAGSRIQVAAAILLHYTGPVFIALYVVIIRHEKLGFAGITAIIGALIGCFLVVGAYHLEALSLNRAGIIGGMLAAMAFAVYTLLGDYGMKKYSPWTVFLYGILFAALMWNVPCPPLSAFFSGYTSVQWIWILFIGIFGTVLPFGFYFEGIKRISPTHAGITATLEPISAGVIAALFLGEKMAPLQIVGGLMVIGSILLLRRKSTGSKKNV